MSNYILDGIMGLCVGDALGVPVEFYSREELRKHPITDMIGYGTHHQPPGTWSDDSSMTLCTLDSLSSGLDYYDIMDKFAAWLMKGKYTPYGEVFDVGILTQNVILKFVNGEGPLRYGGKSEYDNGNGSLMRILPVAFYLYETSAVRKDEAEKAMEEIMNTVHKISSLTHAHIRSQIACGIYITIALELINTTSLTASIKEGLGKAFRYYDNRYEYKSELKWFERLKNPEFCEIPEEAIKSSGYVVDTLEASLWCLLTTKSYRECVLKAVNLGEDTDTVAAVAGGLAGLTYGYDGIPKEWVKQLARRKWIEDLCDKLQRNGCGSNG